MTVLAIRTQRACWRMSAGMPTKLRIGLASTQAIRTIPAPTTA
jgi:hypothetical protein